MTDVKNRMKIAESDRSSLSQLYNISRGRGNLNIRGENWKNVNMVLQENLKNVAHIKLWDFRQCFQAVGNLNRTD